MSDFSAATMLLKLAIVNSRVVRTASSFPSSLPPPAAASTAGPGARREVNEAGGIDSSASVLLGADSSRRGTVSSSLDSGSSVSLLGDATEVGIYR